MEQITEKHRKGDDKKFIEEAPSPKKPQKMDCLTVPLSKHKLDSHNIPIFLVILIETMRKNKEMMQLEGIFRKAGSIEE